MVANDEGGVTARWWGDGGCSPPPLPPSPPRAYVFRGKVQEREQPLLSSIYRTNLGYQKPEPFVQPLLNMVVSSPARRERRATEETLVGLLAEVSLHFVLVVAGVYCYWWGVR